MPRILKIEFEANDEEIDNLLARIGSRGTVVTDDDGDEGGTPGTVGDPNERDRDGIPWLAGIHATTRGKTKEGLWRGAKGVTTEQRAAAEAPYRGHQQTMQVPTFLQPAGAAPVTIPVMPMPGSVAPVMPSMPMPVAPPPVDYQTLVTKLTGQMNAGKLTNEQVYAIYTACGITDPTALMTDETLRRKMMTELEKFG